MKVRTTSPKGFQPFEVQLLIESESDGDALMKIFSLDEVRLILGNTQCTLTQNVIHYALYPGGSL